MKSVFNSTSSHESHSYFKNAVGHLLAHPLGHYIAVEYYAGPRQPADLLAFLSHAGQLLARWGWDKLISEQGQMADLTSAEVEWLTTYWHTQPPPQPHATIFYAALLLPHDMFVRLSWRARGPVAASPFKQGLSIAVVEV
jgi:hypothetical protein